MGEPLPCHDNIMENRWLDELNIDFGVSPEMSVGMSKTAHVGKTVGGVGW